MDFTPKTLPVNLEAEQAVLAAVLMNNRALESVSEFLLPEHFSHPAHKEIYKLALRQFAVGIPFDIITAKNYLEQQGTLESVGGVEYLSRLTAAGATVVNVEHYGRIVFDNARRRDLINLGQSIIDDAYTEDLDKDVTTQIESAEQKLFNLASTGQSERNVVTLADALKSALQEAETAYKADGKLSGLTTGLDDLDKSISGLHRSDLIIIAGRPAMGKTTLALNIAFNAANAILNGRANKQYKGAVAFFSLEMSSPQLATRILSSQSKIPASRMREGSNLTDEDFMKMSQYTDALSKVPIVIDDASEVSVPAIKTRARRIARQFGGIALIVIDYLQLMSSPGGKHNDSRVQELSEITRGLKILAKDLDVPVVVLSQLSRKVEDRDDKRPILSDLRESGSIEQDADIVMFTYREEYYMNGHEPDATSGKATDAMIQNWHKRFNNARNKADVIIAKNRHGKPETVHLSFNGDYSLFDNLHNVGPQPEPDQGFDGQYPMSPTPDVQQVADINDIPDDII